MPRPFLPFFLLLLPLSLAGATTARERFRGGKVEWTRLNTGSPYWNRHSEMDRTVLELMRAHTSLNITPEWQSTRPSDLAALCRYPFVYAESIATLNDAEARNLGEYLKRGGFLLIDGCGNSTINPSPENYFDDQIRILRKSFPDLRIGSLQPDHEVFSIYFKMREFPPWSRPLDDHSWLDQYHPPLRAIFAGGRMVAIISVSLQCAWAGFSRIGNDVECMQMVTNIYIYAMTR